MSRSFGWTSEYFGAKLFQVSLGLILKYGLHHQEYVLRLGDYDVNSIMNQSGYSP
jgi:hypothetical protein